MGNSNQQNVSRPAFLDYSNTRSCGFIIKRPGGHEQRLARSFHQQTNGDMIFERLTYPVISAAVVGAASSANSVNIGEHMSIIAALLGIAVTIGLWGLGHLISISIKVGQLETKLEDMKQQIQDLKDLG